MRPFGYEPDRVTVKPKEAAVVKAAASRVLAGESLRSLCRWLNEDATVPTPGGRSWQPVVLRRVLVSPRIAGLVKEDGKKPVKASWPAILDHRTSDKLRAVLTDPARRVSTTLVRTYLLTGGLAHCGLCGASLIARPSNTGRRGYVCATGAPTNGCGRIRASADPLEEHVVNAVLARLARPSAARAIARALARSEKNEAQLQEQIAHDEAQLRDLGLDYADGVIGRIEFHAARARVASRLDAAKRSLAGAVRVDELPEFDADNLAAWWGEASLDQQRALIDLMVDRIVVDAASVRGSKLFEAGRVRIVWR